MLPDIDLRPKKEKKNRTGLFPIIFILVVTLMVVGGFGYWTWTLEQDNASLEQALQQQKQQNDALQSELEGDESEQQSEQVEPLVTQMEAAIVEMEPIMKTITGYVPRNGDLIAFNEQEGVIELTVQTESNENAVAFYQDLSEVESFHDVMIRTIDYMESEDYYLTNYTVYLQAEEEENDDEAE
ncbi:hypothetical protein [Alkalibacillus almallahensis]|uniref:hypothetical protein n=1 Tax=Alkalibacillus almallahensis TaxID=1379154 RepID=UPI00141F46D4|nr:hypothetical protein [Alkalibacillus almallahensis]NIK11587.1 Tfp pilus assembly protein PilN [Alkalibacillus almallahensis]